MGTKYNVDNSGNITKLNTIKLDSITAPTPSAGLIYFDSASNKLKICEDGSNFVETGEVSLNDWLIHEAEILQFKSSVSAIHIQKPNVIADTFSVNTGYMNTVNTLNTTAEYGDILIVYQNFDGLLNTNFSDTNVAVGPSYAYLTTNGIRCRLNSYNLEPSYNTSGSNQISGYIPGALPGAGIKLNFAFKTGTSPSTYNQGGILADTGGTKRFCYFHYGEGGNAGPTKFFVRLNNGTNDTAAVNFTLTNNYTDNTWYIAEMTIKKVAGAGNWSVKLKINRASDNQIVVAETTQAFTNAGLDTASWWTYAVADGQSSGSAGYSFDEMRLYKLGGAISTYKTTSGLKYVECDLGAISGTVVATRLVTNDEKKLALDDVYYYLSDGVNNDTNLALSERNELVNLTGNPTKLRIYLSPGVGSTDSPSVYGYALYLYKS